MPGTGRHNWNCLDRLDPNQKQRLDTLLTEHPALAGIYELKKKLSAHLRPKTQSNGACRRHARSLLKLIAALLQSDLEHACTLAKSLSECTEEIVRMWRFTKNNGITEGFHRKMKLRQRRAYGFISFSNYRLRVIAQCG
jgi:transposase